MLSWEFMDTGGAAVSGHLSFTCPPELKGHALVRFVPRHHADVSGRLGRASQRQQRVTRALPQAWVPALMVLRSVLVNQQCIWNKVSLNRNTHKTMLSIDQLMKTCRPKARGTYLVLYFPGSEGSGFPSSVFAAPS